MIDAHLHLDRFDDPISALARLREVGLETALIPGVCEPFAPPQGLEELDYAYGQHPLYDPSPGWVDRLERAIATDRPSALGELGVDRQAGPDQLEVLAAQLQLGRRERLPLIVHLVGDGGALLASLRGHTSSVMLHRCSGRPSRFEAWWKAGVYISVGPRVGEDLRLLSAVPDHLLLLESDAEHEGQRPWETLPALYDAAARAKKRASGSIKALISDNYRRFLKGT